MSRVQAGGRAGGSFGRRVGSDGQTGQLQTYTPTRRWDDFVVSGRAITTPTTTPTPPSPQLLPLPSTTSTRLDVVFRPSEKFAHTLVLDLGIRSDKSPVTALIQSTHPEDGGTPSRLNRGYPHRFQLGEHVTCLYGLDCGLYGDTTR